MTDQQNKSTVTHIRITAKHDKFIPAQRARQIAEGEKMFEIESEHKTYSGLSPIKFSTEYTRYFLHVTQIVSISYQRSNGTWENIPLLDWMRTDRSRLIPLMTKDKYMMDTIEYARTTARTKRGETLAILSNLARDLRKTHDKLALFDHLSSTAATHADHPTDDELATMKQTTLLITSASQRTIASVTTDGQTAPVVLVTDQNTEVKEKQDSVMVAPVMTIPKTATQAKLHEIGNNKMTDVFGTIGFEFASDIDTYSTSNGFTTDEKRDVFDLSLSGMVKQDESTKIAGLYLFGIDALPYLAPVDELGNVSIPDRLSELHLATIELLKTTLLGFFANNQHRDGFVVSLNVFFMDDTSRVFFARMLREYVFEPLLNTKQIPSVDILIMYVASIPEILSKGFECHELFGEESTCITFNVNHHLHI